MNRRDTRKLAARIRADLRKIQVPWDTLTDLPRLEPPPDPLQMGEIAKELGHRPGHLGHGHQHFGQ
jgi:hypothetical protein